MQSENEDTFRSSKITKNTVRTIARNADEQRKLEPRRFERDSNGYVERNESADVAMIYYHRRREIIVLQKIMQLGLAKTGLGEARFPVL